MRFLPIDRVEGWVIGVYWGLEQEERRKEKGQLVSWTAAGRHFNVYRLKWTSGFKGAENVFSQSASYYEWWGPTWAQNEVQFLLFHLRDFCMWAGLCWKKVDVTFQWTNQDLTIFDLESELVGLFVYVARTLSIKSMVLMKQVFCC